MDLYVGQICGSIPVPGNQRRLITTKYQYMLTAEGDNEALFRWEYVREPHPSETWCRHHLQGRPRIVVGTETVRLNEWHLPTGYVPLEEIVRFCLVDLDVPPLSDDWHAILLTSYKQFREELAHG
jgi:hypothetical protein